MRSPASSRTANGSLPVLNGELSIAEWKSVLSKLNAAAAAETVVANYIYDPVCDYEHSVRILRRVLQAWGELKLNGHGGGLGTTEQSHENKS